MDDDDDDSTGGVYCIKGEIEEHAKVFSKTTPADVDTFYLGIPPSVKDVLLPPNFLSSHRVIHSLCISCSKLTPTLLEIHSDAFNSSRRTLKTYFIIERCDLSRLDFTFLAGFRKLDTLHLANVSNIVRTNWSRMPVLPSLEIYLDIAEKIELNDIDNDDDVLKFPVGLYKVELNYQHLGDELTDRILLNIFYSSGKTLTILHISAANLTRIPRQLASFRKLNQLKIRCTAPGAKLKVIEPNSLNFSAPVTFVDIQNCGIEEIKPGAFRGNTARHNNFNEAINF